jgi:hypothetical protein
MATELTALRDAIERLQRLSTHNWDTHRANPLDECGQAIATIRRLMKPFKALPPIEKLGDMHYAIGTPPPLNSAKEFILPLSSTEALYRELMRSCDLWIEWIERQLPPDDEWLPADSPTHIAKSLSMSLDTLKRYIKADKIRVDKVSERKWRILAEDAAKFRDISD